MVKRILFYGAVAIQLALLLGMIGREAYTTSHGTRIMLKCLPVDPRGLFRGDYVILNYEISRPELAALKGMKEHYRGEPVYVTLRKNGPFWSATGVYATLPTLAGEETFIKGRFSAGDQVEYGIESFYVPEGKGRAIETRGRSQTLNLNAEIALDRFGHGVVTQIFLDGRAVP
jgi:uncharacterized membrane-anchored protein